MLFLRKCSQYILQKNYISVAKQYMDFMQILPHKQTVWTHPSLTQSFNHRANTTKQLFCFQLKWKVRPKRSSNTLNSSFLSAISTKQPTSRNLTALHPGKFECSLMQFLPQIALMYHTILPKRKLIQMSRVRSRDQLPSDIKYACQTQSLYQNICRKQSL